MTDFTHFNAQGQAHMVDVGDKAITERRAVAAGRIRMLPATLELIQTGGAKKGDVLAVARLAGIMATKRTSDLIPLCHPLPLTHVALEFTFHPEQNALAVQAEVKTSGKTGVEIEALMAVQVALLTVYDMCKALDRGMCIEGVQLHEKSGGRSGQWSRNPA